VSRIGRAKTVRRPGAGLGNFDFTIAGRGVRNERIEEFMSRSRHLVDRASEGELVRTIAV